MWIRDREKAWNLCDEKKFYEAMEALTEGRTAQVPREYYEELTETVRAGLQEPVSYTHLAFKLTSP